MFEGRSQNAWGHTSSVMALVANVFRGAKSRVARPADFNPHLARRRRKRVANNFDRLCHEIMRVSDRKRREYEGRPKQRRKGG